MFIDTHCHLSQDDYDNIDEVVLDNIKANVLYSVISGCTKDSIHESLEFANKYSNIYVTIGYHPSEADIITSDDLLLLNKLIKENKVVGVGEIGLDYHYGKENMYKQQELFRMQMSIAEKNGLPVVIHSRDAVNDTIQILKEFPKVTGIIHCFSGSYETALLYINRGYKIGIGGVVTFKNSNLVNVVQKIGLSNIVLETDAPYLTPEPFRGRKNSSKYLKYIADKIADALNLSVSDVAVETTEIAKALFDLK